MTIINPPFSPLNTRPGVLNYGPQQLPKWRKALGNFRNGTYVPKLACFGDSTTWGTLSDGTASGLKSKGYPDGLATILTSLGLAAHADSFFGMGGNTLANYQIYNPKVSGGAGWVPDVNETLGGPILDCPNTVTASLNFLPTNAWNAVDLYYFDNPTTATIAASVNGGAAFSSFTTSGGSTLAKRTFNTGSGAAVQTLNLARTAGGTIYICGMICYDTANSKIAVMNWGRPAWKAGDGANTAAVFSALNALGTFAPDLTIINFGINDWNTGTTISSYTTSMQSIITKAQISGDVVLMVPCQSNPANFASVSTQLQFVTALNGLAMSNNVSLIDVNYRFGGTFTAANSNGFMGDDRHPNGAGYFDNSSGFSRLIAYP